MHTSYGMARENTVQPLSLPKGYKVNGMEDVASTCVIDSRIGYLFNRHLYPFPQFTCLSIGSKCVERKLNAESLLPDLKAVNRTSHIFFISKNQLGKGGEFARLYW